MDNPAQITACVERYYHSLRTSDPTVVRSVFHEHARITGYLPDGLHQMTVEEFAGFVEAQQPTPEDSGEPPMLEILSCEIAGATAVVRLRERYLGMVFLDSFSMLKVDDAWCIYTKLFHVEG